MHTKRKKEKKREEKIKETSQAVCSEETKKSGYACNGSILSFTCYVGDQATEDSGSPRNDRSIPHAVFRLCSYFFCSLVQLQHETIGNRDSQSVFRNLTVSVTFRRVLLSFLRGGFSFSPAFMPVLSHRVSFPLQIKSSTSQVRVEPLIVAFEIW